MRLVLTFVVLAIAFAPSMAAAQQAGENINVLPVMIPVDDNNDGLADDPAWYIKGDGYLQRQVEPTIAASTRNPDHLLAFFVDRRRTNGSCRPRPRRRRWAVARGRGARAATGPRRA